MEAISKAPKLLLIVDHHSVGSSERFHALYHTCVASIEHYTDVAIQLRTKISAPAQEAALIGPLIQHHQDHHADIPLHINALSAEPYSGFHQHLCRARWQSSNQNFTQPFSASLDQPVELDALLEKGKPDFLIVGPVGMPRSKSRELMGPQTLAELSESRIPLIGVGGVSAKGISEGSIPRCDGYAILTPVLNALDAPAKWHRELDAWKPFLNGETK